MINEAILREGGGPIIIQRFRKLIIIPIAYGVGVGHGVGEFGNDQTGGEVCWLSISNHKSPFY